MTRVRWGGAFGWVGMFLAAGCGESSAAADAASDARTGVDVPAVMGRAACERIQGWDNRASSGCQACLQAMCGPQQAAIDTMCMNALELCNPSCGGPTRCACQETCLTAADAGSCLAAWQAANDCVANLCVAQCR